MQRDDDAALIAAGNDAMADPAQVWDSPSIDDNLKLWGNFGRLFAAGVQSYGYANYARRTVEAASSSGTPTRGRRCSAPTGGAAC